MYLISFARSLGRRVAAAAVVLGAVNTAAASDVPAAAVPAPAALVQSSAPCASCQAPAGAPCGPMCNGKMCPTGLRGRMQPAYQTKLCPGACFGYFQTQWSKWEDVCPVPHIGQGVSDSPALRTSPVTPVRPPAGTDPKKTADTKKDATGETKKDVDPKFNKDGKGNELPPPRTGSGNGTTLPPMPVSRTNPLPLIPQAPRN